MKVLHINCSDSGSTGKIIHEISLALYNAGGVSVLCTPKQTVNDCPYLKKYIVSSRIEQGINIRINAVLGMPYGITSPSTYRIIGVIKNERPDIVHFHSSNRYMANLYTLFRFLGKHNIPVVITNHAEFFYTGSCAHANNCDQWIMGCEKCKCIKSATGSVLFDNTKWAWKKMRYSLSRINKLTVVSVSPWVMNRALKSGIMKDKKQLTILNGVNTDIFRPLNDRTILDSLNISYKAKIVVFVTAMFSDNPNDPKGGNYLIELARRFLNNNTYFLVIGKNNINSNIPDNIIIIGQVNDQNLLANYYSIADATIVLGKRETYSMPVAESLCCGTPVVGFLAGGPESIAIPQFSSFVSYGDIDALEKSLNLYLNTPKEKNICLLAKEKYSSKEMVDGYLKVYSDLIEQ